MAVYEKARGEYPMNASVYRSTGIADPQDKIAVLGRVLSLLCQALTGHRALLYQLYPLTFPLCRFVQVLCGSPMDTP